MFFLLLLQADPDWWLSKALGLLATFGADGAITAVILIVVAATAFYTLIGRRGGD